MSDAFFLDANAFIQLKQKFYAFDICPGYRTALIAHQQGGRLRSIDRVRDEIAEGGDDLWDWTKDTCPAEGFATTWEGDIVGNYARLQAWVGASAHYTAGARTAPFHDRINWLAVE